MPERWFFALEGDRKGPVEAPEMAELIREGVVATDTPVWREGMADWEPAGRFFDSAAPPMPRPETAGKPAATRDYRRDSGMTDAAREVFRRYFDFRGRSNRGEFWYWVLDSFLIGLALGVLDGLIFGGGESGGGGAAILSPLWSLTTLVPSVALGARRLHDTGRSGWWLLLAPIPVVGFVVLVWWFAQRPVEPNRWG